MTIHHFPDGDSLSADAVRQTVVDTNGGVLLVLAAEDCARLAVLAEPSCDLGQIGYESAMLGHRVCTELRACARNATGKRTYCEQT
jgi:hypothetical protein